MIRGIEASGHAGKVAAVVTMPRPVADDELRRIQKFNPSPLDAKEQFLGLRLSSESWPRRREPAVE